MWVQIDVCIFFAQIYLKHFMIAVNGVFACGHVDLHMCIRVHVM